jgi:transaldolase/transaldolase/glucose-6-phosphate isomerase
LRRLIQEDGLSGVTSNPAIFEESIGGSDDYDADIEDFGRRGDSPADIYLKLTVKDIQEAADELRPVYDRTQGADGYVSLEVSPLLARDTAGTINEAKSLWAAVAKPNVMIKIPATKEGLSAIEECISAGININITLLFSLERYREVAGAFIRGLERRAAAAQDVRNVRSVASFFLSRIDVMIDPMLHDASLKGEAAIASAKLAYQIYKEVFGGDRFGKLEQKGARKQWLLWASTSTKSKEYSDVKYVEPLIGPETINTMPVKTLEAYRDHGDPAPRLEQDVEHAHDIMRRLKEAGIDLNAVTGKLEQEGIDKFVKPFEKLARTLQEKTSALQAAR